MKKSFACVLALALASLSANEGLSQGRPAAPPPETSWVSWGNGARVNNFSPAAQLTPANIGQVKPIWVKTFAQRGGWEMTPIVVGGVMYGIDLQGQAFALDPETGKELWTFASGLKGSNRAVSYWPGDTGHKPRILMAIEDRIYAIDAATGKAVTGFGGKGGYIDIREGFAPTGPGAPAYRMSSPPNLYKNLMITGAATQEFGSKGPPADPRAYDVVTGKLVWRFNIVPKPGDPNFGGFGESGWQGRSGPSTWGVFSVDEETGSVFIPVGQPADNFVGIDRPGDNLYSDSVLALDAATGKYKWHFQVVRHDLWDFDLAAPPVLVDLNVNGQRVPALVEATKQGMIFILDRRNGKPVFGVEDRPVPASTIPGEQAAPTQPFPIKPPVLVRTEVSRQDITTITPEANRYCTDMWNRMGFKAASIYTPPALNAPLLYTPANAGGAGGVWGGVSVDPRSNTLFVNVAQVVSYVSVLPEDVKADGAPQGPATAGYLTRNAFTKWMDPNGFPCIQPPWGEMVAINGNTGDILWRSPLGRAEVYGDLGAHTGILNYGGSMATAGGLVFIGGSTVACSQCKYDDPTVRAFDAKSGREVWGARLSAGSKSNLMTFVGKSGRQYVVATSSGRPNTDVTMVAFAIPRPGEAVADPRPAAPWPSVLGKSAAAAPAVIARAADLPGGPGKDDVARVCTACHSLETVTAVRADRAGWAGTVATMKSRGAQMDAATEARIVAYLSGHFGPPGQAARLGPNGEVE